MHQSKYEKWPRGGVGGRRDGGQSLEVQVSVSTHMCKWLFTVQGRAGLGGMGRKLGLGYGLFLFSVQVSIMVGLEFAFGGCLVVSSPFLLVAFYCPLTTLWHVYEDWSGQRVEVKLVSDHSPGCWVTNDLHKLWATLIKCFLESQHLKIWRDLRDHFSSPWG